MAIKGVQSHQRIQFSPEYISLIAYLNPENPRKTDHEYRAFALSALSDDEFTVLMAMLKKTHIDKLDLQIESITTEQALALLEITLSNKQLVSKHMKLGQAFELRENIQSDDPEVLLNNLLSVQLPSASQQESEKIGQIMNISAAKVFELDIKDIPVGCILYVLAVIGMHPFVTHIDIKMPLYNVDNLSTLREFLKKPVSEQAPLASQEEDMSVMFANMLTIAQADLAEIRTAASEAATSIYDRGRSFLSAYISPVVQAIRDDLNGAMELDEPDTRQDARPTI